MTFSKRGQKTTFRALFISTAAVRDKCSVSVTKFQGRYFLEYCIYNEMDSLLCHSEKELHTSQRDA